MNGVELGAVGGNRWLSQVDFGTNNLQSSPGHVDCGQNDLGNDENPLGSVLALALPTEPAMMIDQRAIDLDNPLGNTMNNHNWLKNQSINNTKAKQRV